MKKLAYYGAIILVVCLATGWVAFAFVGDSAPKVVVEGDYIEAPGGGGDVSLGALASPHVFYKTTFHKGVMQKKAVRAIAPTSSTSVVTLLDTESGSDVLLSASGTTITLPAVAYTGTYFKFIINGAATDDNFIIDSAEGDNINGTLSVNNADVACSGEDQLNFVIDGETIGDWVEIVSDGTQWIITGSEVETAAKLTCTDPS